MLLRMLAVTLFLVAGLSAATACPVIMNDGCLARDMQTGRVSDIRINGSTVSWSLRGESPFRTYVERIRLGAREIAMLRAAADGRTLKVHASHRPRQRQPLWVKLVPAATGLSVLLFVMVRLRRRQAITVRVLTRNVERREAFALVYATLMAFALVWATWPNTRAVTMDQLRTGLELGLIHDVTFGQDYVCFRHVASSTTFVVPEAAPPELKMSVRRAIIHAPDPEHPRETLHHIRVRDESGIAGLLIRSIPWAGALAFWAVWLYLIRRQSWW